METSFDVNASLNPRVFRDVPDIVNNYNLEQLRQQRNEVLNNLFKDPETFAKTLFRVEKRGIIKRQSILYSPSLKINDKQFCCLIRSSDPGDPQVCAFSQVVEKYDGFLVSIGPPQGLLEGNKQARGLPSTELKQLQDRLQSNQYFIKVFPKVNNSIVYNVNPPSFIKTNDVSLYNNCNGNRIMQPDYYIGSDDFTNAILIGYILNLIYPTDKDVNQQNQVNILQGVVKTYGATICTGGSSNTGVLVMGFPNLGNFIDITNNLITNLNLTSYWETANINGQQVVRYTSNFITGVFKQALANLDYLWNLYNFNHGGLTASQLYLSEESVNYTYRGYNFSYKFTVKFTDFMHAAITIQNPVPQPKPTGQKPGVVAGNPNSNNDNGSQMSYLNMRLYNRSGYAEKLLYASQFKPSINQDPLTKELYYKLGGAFNKNSLTEIRHMGQAYYGSFDAYTLMVSMFIIPDVFYIVFDNSYNEEIFNTMFFREDRSLVYNMIKDAVEKKKPNNYDTILPILRGKKLKCNVVEDLLNLLITV